MKLNENESNNNKVSFLSKIILATVIAGSLGLAGANTQPVHAATVEPATETVSTTQASTPSASTSTAPASSTSTSASAGASFGSFLTKVEGAAHSFFGILGNVLTIVTDVLGFLSKL